MLSKNHDQEKGKAGKTSQYVVFKIGGQEFGVEIKQAREIINSRELTSIPNAPDFVEGVTNLRGEIVPIIGLRERLNTSKVSSSEENKIIIVEINGTLTGMKVDDVEGIIRLAEDNIGKAPKITQGINKEYISGVGKLDKKLLILLNLNRVLSRDEVEQLEDIEMD